MVTTSTLLRPGDGSGTRIRSSSDSSHPPFDVAMVGGPVAELVLEPLLRRVEQEELPDRRLGALVDRLVEEEVVLDVDPVRRDRRSGPGPRPPGSGPMGCRSASSGMLTIEYRSSRGMSTSSSPTTGSSCARSDERPLGAVDVAEVDVVAGLDLALHRAVDEDARPLHLGLGVLGVQDQVSLVGAVRERRVYRARSSRPGSSPPSGRGPSASGSRGRRGRPRG